MIVNVFNTKDGDLWGVWCKGHANKEEVLQVFNETICANGCHPITVDEIDHSYAARINDDRINPNYNFHIVEEDTPSAIPITWVDGELLEAKINTK